MSNSLNTDENSPKKDLDEASSKEPKSKEPAVEKLPDENEDVPSPRVSKRKMKGNAKGKKDILTEELNKNDESSKSDTSEAKDQMRSSKRGSRKRKVEEKENVIDRSIVEEVKNIQNVTEGDKEPVDENNSEKPVKSQDTPGKPKAKKAKKDESHTEDNANLPKGWSRKVVVRKSGKTAGQVDIYIYSPDGTKFRSKPDIAAYLARTKSKLNVDDFSFSKKTVSCNVPAKVAPKKEKASPVAKKAEKKRVKEPETPRKKVLIKVKFSPKKGKNKKPKRQVKTSDSRSKTGKKK